MIPSSDSDILRPPALPMQKKEFAPKFLSQSEKEDGSLSLLPSVTSTKSQNQIENKANNMSNIQPSRPNYVPASAGLSPLVATRALSGTLSEQDEPMLYKQLSIS